MKPMQAIYKVKSTEGTDATLSLRILSFYSFPELTRPTLGLCLERPVEAVDFTARAVDYWESGREEYLEAEDLVLDFADRASLLVA